MDITWLDAVGLFRVSWLKNDALRSRCNCGVGLRHDRVDKNGKYLPRLRLAVFQESLLSAFRLICLATIS